MHVLVTGTTGNVGRRAIKALAQNHLVRAMVRSPSAGLQSNHLELVTGDVTKPESLDAALQGIDAVVHLAAFFRGATPAQMDEVNRQGAINLAEAALAAGVRRFVFASTSLVYGDGLGHAARESDPTGPQFPYPASKLVAEDALLSLHRNDGLDLRILRLAFVYGDGDSHLNDWLPRLREQPLDAFFQLIHHVDVCQAIGLALERDGIGGRIYNVADDELLTVREVLATLGQPRITSGGNGSGPWIGVMDGSRIRSELGFRPTVPSLRDAVARGLQ